MKLQLNVAMSVAALAIGALPMNAELVSYNGTLTSPNGSAATADTGSTSNPSWFNGSGNPQGGWAIDLNNGIELGLRAKIRGVSAILPSDGSTYYAQPISTTGLPNWNYEFSIDLQPGGPNGTNSALTLGSIYATMTINDLTKGTSSGEFNPLTHWGDDTGYGSTAGSQTGPTQGLKHHPENASDWVAQNSENLGFGDSPLHGVYFGDPDDYQFTLNIYSDNTEAHLLASDTMDVQVAPEPSSVVMMAGGAFLLFLLARRRLVA
jgi:hypothetical protein